MFRQTEALSLLFSYHIPIKGTQHRSSRSWFRFFLFAKDAQETLALGFLGLFLHTLLHDYRYLTGYLIVDGLLLFKYLYNLAHLPFLIFEKMAYTVDTLRRIGSLETAQHTIHCHTLSMVMFQIFIIPFQYCFT